MYVLHAIVLHAYSLARDSEGHVGDVVRRPPGFAVLLAAAPAAPALGQDLAANSQVEIAYLPPTNPALETIYQQVKTRGILEEMQKFLSPLKLPHKLTVQTGQCGATYVPYEHGPVTICYEYLDQIERLAPAKVSSDGVTRANAITGAFVQVALHDVAEAVFNELQVPIWGRVEDAADKIAGLIMMQFGTDVALRVLTGTTYFFQVTSHTWTGVDFSDERGTEDQRFYNYLCIAYGGDPKTFGYVVTNNLLPKSRADRCAHEYSELVYAFRHDHHAVRSIRSCWPRFVRREWVRPNDGGPPTPDATPPTTTDGADAKN